MSRALWYGYNAPFGINNGGTTWQNDVKLIKNDLIQLLLTAPGERVMRPGYGSPIPIFPFESLDEVGVRQLHSAIIRTVEKFEPRVRVTRLDIEPDPDNNLITIKLYAAALLDKVEEFVLELGLPNRRVING